MVLDYSAILNPNPTVTLPTQSCYYPTWYPWWQVPPLPVSPYNPCVPSYMPSYTTIHYYPDPTIEALQQQVAQLKRRVQMLKRRNARARKRR